MIITKICENGDVKFLKVKPLTIQNLEFDVKTNYKENGNLEIKATMKIKGLDEHLGDQHD